MTHSSHLFTHRAHYYHSSRPHYPRTLLNHLVDHTGFTAKDILADVGAGTGILSELFLTHGNRVYALDPNREMLAAAHTHLHAYSNFSPIAGAAEALPFPNNHLDAITIGQAFHWFDRPAAKTQFFRVLVPGGLIAIAQNIRDPALPVFLEFQAIASKYSINPEKPSHVKMDKQAETAAFFSPSQLHYQTFPNPLSVNFERLSGGLLSTSDAPLPGHPNHIPMLAELRKFFDQHQQDGLIRLPFITELYWGRISA